MIVANASIPVVAASLIASAEVNAKPAARAYDATTLAQMDAIRRAEQRRRLRRKLGTVVSVEADAAAYDAAGRPVPVRGHEFDELV